MQRAWNQEQRQIATIDFQNIAVKLLHFVHENEPLTFPELLGSLPWHGTLSRLVIAAKPQIVLWDEVSEVAAKLLTYLFSTQKLALQVCRPQLYDVSDKRPKLPAAQSVCERGAARLWLP